MLDGVNVRFNSGDVADGGTAKLPISTSEMGDPTQGMRSAGAGRSSPPKPVVDLSDVRGNSIGRPLSVEAPEFSPMMELSAPEPLEHSVMDEDLDGRPMEGLSVPEPLEHSVLDEDLDGRPMEGLSVPEPLEHSVLDEDLDGRPMEGLSVLEPLEHSVLDEDLDG